MSDVSDKSSRRSVRRQRSIYQVHYSIRRQDSEMTARPLALATSPLEVQAYALQVAGHASTQDTKYLGKRTWDPLATEEKRKNEESKYALCKQQYGFCIPGFQVFRLGSGKMQRYNKDYGKKLQGQAVKDE
ncbi:hypothetical protein B5X24_HaOG208752 [Helicoverpa armigera]|uniref:Uncharacterized protein n=1 Tax=Helicoverpa armigera TaxID=29058 RepID=A0A2W1BLT6_HELAM|nr:hypothetical protein B5X24_HaOG208752 [Helicoverpa armigera]